MCIWEEASWDLIEALQIRVGAVDVDHNEFLLLREMTELRGDPLKLTRSRVSLQ